MCNPQRYLGVTHRSVQHSSVPACMRKQRLHPEKDGEGNGKGDLLRGSDGAQRTPNRNPLYLKILLEEALRPNYVHKVKVLIYITIS